MKTQIRFPNPVRVFLTCNGGHFVDGSKVDKVEGAQVTLVSGHTHRIHRAMLPHAAYWATQNALKRAAGKM